MTEAQRAAEYRLQEARRVQWERDNALRMRGSAVAQTQLQADWQPLENAARDARQTEPVAVERHDRTRWSPA